MLGSVTVEPLRYMPNPTEPSPGREFVLMTYVDGETGRGMGPCLYQYCGWGSLFNFVVVARVSLYGPWHIPERSE